MFLANSQITINLGVGFVFGLLCAWWRAGAGETRSGGF
jgi:hypothetical protein